MKIQRFDAETGRSITAFESNFLLHKLLHAAEPDFVHVGYITIPPGGVIGYHQAKIRQLLLVVQGEGEVRGESPDFTPITVGEAALWEEGEFHETRSATGLTAIVIESPSLSSQ